MKLEKDILIRPAFDKRDPEPSKNYGIHGVEMTFILKGVEGAVQFVIFTNWMLPHVTEELDAKSQSAGFAHLHCHPMAADLGYHSPKPMYDGHEALKDDCSIIGGKCYYDGSGLNAEAVMTTMVAEGDDAMWAALLDYYNATFETEHELSKAA